MKVQTLTIDGVSASLVRGHIRQMDPRLWRRLVHLSRLDGHNRRVAASNRRSEIRRWLADCARLCADIKAARERGEIRIDGPLLEAAGQFFGERAQ